jgi:hypothetical protein
VLEILVVIFLLENTWPHPLIYMVYDQIMW